jgi:hypothetical protein
MLPSSEEVDHLLHNARLRDDLEPFLDESMELLNMQRLPTPVENEFLASMLAWERAPVLPISQWFDPEMIRPAPETLDDVALRVILWETIEQLYARRICLEFTDHLSDRELYCLICRDILPCHEKKIDLPKNFLHWHCLDDKEDPAKWLRFYASTEEREVWSQETQLPLPPTQLPPFPRKMPCRTS